MHSPNSPVIDPDSQPNRCHHLDAQLRRCRMSVSPNHPTLCGHHATHERQAAEAARLAAHLTEPSPDFKSAADINRVLAQLFSAVSNKRVDLRQGALLAYITQLMLQTTKLPDAAPAAKLP